MCPGKCLQAGPITSRGLRLELARLQVLGHAVPSLQAPPSVQLPLSPPEPAVGPAERT